LGNIKSLLIKKTAKNLLEKYPDRFTKNYQKNKEEVDKLVQINSKSTRNMVVGYLTHIVGRKAVPSIDLQKIVKEETDKGRRSPRRRRR
jgi:small subunit ribosomal protein S17e